MTRLQLASDRSKKLSGHIDELVQRLLLILLFWTIAAVVISTQIDDFLILLLNWLSPCTTSDCLNIYEPATWSGIRWSMVGLLSIIATSPIILQQMLDFASPGLLPDERRWLRNWFIITWLLSLLLTIVMVIWALPLFFSEGHDVQSGMGFSARYDAVAILQTTMYLILLQIIISAACLWVLLGIKIGVITNQLIGWWRLRIHGFTLGILILLSQSLEPSIIIIILALTAWLIELCFSSIKDQKLTGDDSIVYLDSEDCEHQFLLLDCSCLGAMEQQKKVGDIMRYSSNGLCSYADDQDEVLQAIIRSGITDLVVTGCNSMPLPAKFHSSLNSVGCSIRGLELMDREETLEQAWSAMKKQVLFLDAEYTMGHND